MNLRETATNSLPFPLPPESGGFVRSGSALPGSLSLKDIPAFFLVLSVLLAPMRFGAMEVFRPTTLIFLPCAAYVLFTQLPTAARFLRTRLGIAFGCFTLLLGLGHLLGNDQIEGYYAEDYSVLGWESLLGIALVFLSGIILGQCKEFRRGLTGALFMGLVIHVVCIALLPSAMSFRQHDRMSGLLGDPNILLLHILPVYFLWLGMLRTRVATLFAQLLLPAILWAALQSLSRAGLVALLIGLAVQGGGFVIYSRTMRERWWATALMLSMPLVLFAAFQLAPGFMQERLDAFTSRQADRVSMTGGILEDRMLWMREMQTHSVSDHLLNPVGMGYGTFQRDNAILPHNTFIDVYIISGPLGLLLYGGLFLLTFKSCLTVLRSHRQSGSSTYGVVAMLTCLIVLSLMLSTLSVLPWKINWLILGVLLGHLHQARNQVA